MKHDTFAILVAHYGQAVIYRTPEVGRIEREVIAAYDRLNAENEQLRAERTTADVASVRWENEAHRLEAENERLREVERKAQEQSEYIQRHGLTEIEVAALRAENARMRSGLEQIIAIGEESHGMDVTVSMFYAAHRALAR